MQFRIINECVYHHTYKSEMCARQSSTQSKCLGKSTVKGQCSIISSQWLLCLQGLAWSYLWKAECLQFWENSNELCEITAPSNTPSSVTQASKGKQSTRISSHTSTELIWEQDTKTSSKVDVTDLPSQVSLYGNMDDRKLTTRRMSQIFRVKLHRANM